nr:DUF6431 domain-containing protein [Alicyclobacillus macrosporangiidus]
MFFVRSAENVPCPCCQGELRVIGSRKRTWVQSSGDKVKLIIRRLRCRDCNKIHHELPNFLVPYRRHEAQVIEDAVTDQAIPACVEESTLRRWRQWFKDFAPYAAGCLESHASSGMWRVRPLIHKPHSIESDGLLDIIRVGWRVPSDRLQIYIWIHMDTYPFGVLIRVWSKYVHADPAKMEVVGMKDSRKAEEIAANRRQILSRLLADGLDGGRARQIRAEISSLH